MAYVTTAAYLARFGEREAAQLTNTVSVAAGEVAQPDLAKVGEALEDAAQLVDSYLGARYAIPLSSVPPVVVGWSAILAREQLYSNTGRTPEAITAAADRVRGQLRDAAKGIITLPVDPDDLAPVTAGGAPASSGDAIEATFVGTGALRGYMDAFTGGSCVPAWRRGG